MPAPKITFPSATAGELTVGKRISGPPFDQLGLISFASFGVIGKLFITPSLKPRRAGKRMSVAVGTGEAAYFSVDCMNQRTSGFAGPATLSVFPVRRALPR